MPLAFILLLLNLKFLLQATPTTATAADPKTLNITTIAANAQKESVIECWQLTAPFIASAAVGTSGAIFAQLGETGATSYGLIPAKFDGGMHNAPVVQWVAFLAGEAVVSLPNSTQTAIIHGGRYGLILAADTAKASTSGHITKYPSKKETVAIQIPTANNEIPSHSVLHGGACRQEES
ncbi:hypothetical protein JMJ35_004374 [Cladonia borealis]|uniref:Small secreted protein n=1 Tax=Cladonia borealis TaxID=184061 RepID=A0AA39V2E6_9LECA|nr:hypothetical protein JMJ35_004374 [Cladonia borealis]